MRQPYQFSPIIGLKYKLSSLTGIFVMNQRKPVNILWNLFVKSKFEQHHFGSCLDQKWLGRNNVRNIKLDRVLGCPTQKFKNKVMKKT